jgi:thymidylate synthase
MVKEVERDLFEMGTRYQSATVQDQDVKDDPKFQTIELIGYAYTLQNLSEESMWDALGYMGKDHHYSIWMQEESDERLGRGLLGGPLNPGHAWKKRQSFWGKFLRNGFFSYSYAERWQHQLPYIIRELQAKPNTRQAILTMYDQHQDMLNWGGFDRVPCSVSYQFVLRQGKLSVIYNQRSCDFMNFFLADVYFTIELLKHVCAQTGNEPGEFIHFLGSLHAFAGDLEGRNIF